MYLLDNYKKNVSKNVLESISELQDFNSLIKQSNNDFNKITGIKNYFHKITMYFRFSSNKEQSKELYKEKVKNIFLNPPISMNENSEEFKEISQGIEKNIFANKYGNFGFSNIYNGKTIIELYTEKLIFMLKDNNTKSSYDIVGDINKTFSTFFYGNKVVSKDDMDQLLFDIEQNNNLKTEINFTDENIEELKNLSKQMEINFDENNLEKVIKDISIELSRKDEMLSRNLNSLKTQQLKTINYEHKKGFFNTLREKLTEKEYEFLINEKEIIPKRVVGSYSVKDMIESLKNFEKTNRNKFISIISFDEETILKNKIKKIIKELDKKEEIKLNKIKETKEKIYEEYNNSSYKIEYNDKLKEFQRLNKIFAQSKTIEYNRYVLNSFTTTYQLFGYEQNNEFKSFLKEILKNFKNKDDYKINDIKQFLYIALSNNKRIYDLVKTTNFLENIENNKFIKDLIEKKITINLNEFDVDRLNYIYKILVHNKNIEKLFQSEISIDIKNAFFKKLELTTDSKKGEEALNDIFKIFHEKSKNINMKENNILILMIIYSYENNEFNENRFNELYSIFKKPLNKLDKKDKEIINNIDDNWLKWSLLVGREVKDRNLISSSINPIDFEFNKIETLKKIFNNNIKEKEIYNKNDLNFIHLLSKHSQGNENNILNLYKKYNELNEYNVRNIYDSIGRVFATTKQKKFNNYINMFNRNLSNLLENNNEFTNNKLNNLLKKDIKFHDLFEEVIKLSNYTYLKKDPKINQFNLSEEKIYSLLSGNKDVVKGMLKIEDQKLFDEIFKNIKDIPKMSEAKFLNYIKYYEEMSKTEKFQNFKENDLLIPIVSKNINDEYSYRIKTIKDFDLLLTGEKTDCCMTIKEKDNGSNGAGFSIYSHIYNNPKTNAIFEVCKNGKTIANSWVWRKDNQICFDNIEVLGKDIRTNIMNCYRDASLNMINKDNSIDLISFGVGNSDIKVDELGLKITNNHYEVFDVMNVYTDSHKQLAIVSTNPFILDTTLMINKLKEANVDENEINVLKEIINKNLDNNDLKIKIDESKSIKKNIIEIHELDF